MPLFLLQSSNVPGEADSLQVDSDSDVEMPEAKSTDEPAGKAAKATPMATPTTAMATPTTLMATPMATPIATSATDDLQRQLQELQQKYAELLARQGHSQVPTHKGQKAAPIALAGAELSEKDAPTAPASSQDGATAVAEGLPSAAPDASNSPEASDQHKRGAATGDTADLHEFYDLEKKDARADSKYLFTKLFDLTALV